MPFVSPGYKLDSKEHEGQEIAPRLRLFTGDKFQEMKSLSHKTNVYLRNLSS